MKYGLQRKLFKHNVFSAFIMPKEKLKVVCRAIIEMMGSPKKHIEDTIKMYVDKIKEDHKNITILNKFISKAKKQKGNELFNVFAELEMEVSGMENLIWFCFDYMPASIEISDPEQLVFNIQDFTAFINDFLAKMHKVDTTLKHFAAENQVLGKNGITLMKNIINIQLKSGPKTPEMLALGAGTPVDHIQKFLDSMEHDGKVKRLGKEYVLNA
jgi:hypothetical protein